MSEVTREDVLRVAELAHLDLTADELPRMQRDLSAILGHIAQLNELSTEGVPPMAQVSEITEGFKQEIPGHGTSPLKRVAGVAEERGAALRPDVVAPCLDRKTVMSQAPETDGRFFKVPKVIER